MPQTISSAVNSARLLAAATAVTFAIGTSAFAQTPAPPTPAAKPAEKKPAAKPAPKAPQAQAPAPAAPAPAPPAGQAAAAQEVPQLMYTPWVRICDKATNDPKAKQICISLTDGKLENGAPVVVVQLIEPEGDPRKLIRVVVPLGMQIQHGTRMIVDQDTPVAAPYFICLPNGCMADYEANADTVARLKKGKTLTVQAINLQGQEVSLRLPLTDFAKVYDGPPTDPKAYASFEEQQRKLREEAANSERKLGEGMEKKAEEMRKMEGQKPAAGAATAPPKQ